MLYIINLTEQEQILLYNSIAQTKNSIQAELDRMLNNYTKGEILDGQKYSNGVKVERELNTLIHKIYAAITEQRIDYQCTRIRR